MDIFDLDRALVGDYREFARSFTQIRAPDLRQQIDDEYATGRFWPEPLITVNPNFEPGERFEKLVSDGSLLPETADIFRVDGRTIRLHRHQTQAIAKAVGGQSFVVTTGTGSGKSLCFFVPIIDRAVRARKEARAVSTKAIIVYPMNALANSQMEEIGKFIGQSGLPEALRPTFARYTGQESAKERADIRALKPDILLTNFMMLELLMTRQNDRDRDVIESARDLEFLVLDELHTYRGRQGADVAMLVRRVRDRLCKTRAPICIGTSATMASEGPTEDRAAVVARVASRLFGTRIEADAVIDESLKRATDSSLRLDNLGESLGRTVDEQVPDRLDNAALKTNPLAVWIELTLGLKDGQRLARQPPISVEEAANRLNLASGRPTDSCRRRIQEMLSLMSRPESDRGGTGSGAFLAFKLHRFISGAGYAYATLRAPGARRVSLEGQKYDPQDREARLYPLHFCRSCGREYHPVTFVRAAREFIARPIDETPTDGDDASEVSGYLTPVPDDDTDFRFSGDVVDFPEEWQERGASGPRLKSDKRLFAPRRVFVGADGKEADSGRPFWLVPGKFRFCLACGDLPAAQMREFNKLGSLSAEGRSSATTVMVSSILRWMNGPNAGLPASKRKLLGFTDNRQDAALQAGHFNDFVFVSLLRAATLAAVRNAGPDGLGDEDVGARIQSALGFRTDNARLRAEWMADPVAKGVQLINAGKSLAKVLRYRAWADQRRGWRYTNPNLEDLGLVKVKYLSLDELAEDAAALETGPTPLREARGEMRRAAFTVLFDYMRKGLAVTTEALDASVVEEVGNSARLVLLEPWSIGRQERLRTAAALMVDPPAREEAGVQGEPLVIRAGARSGLARILSRSEFWGRRLTSQEYPEVLTAMLSAAEQYGLLRQAPTAFERPGWRMAAEAIRFVAGEGSSEAKKRNIYFTGLYENLADMLGRETAGLFGMEGREHTAQVDRDKRKWREWRFRWGKKDQENLIEAKAELRNGGEPDDFLPVLFCSPTMELGVDISELNAVYLRNVPPTPANYAQRSGRAGRSGQAALVVTYCSAQGPHDQYYFNQPRAMVSGVVRPPALELANRDLIEGHLHAVWLAEAGVELPPDIPHVLDLADPQLKVRESFAAPLSSDALKDCAAVSMERILASVKDELADSAPWAADRANFARETADRASDMFSSAFKRWRQLYAGARNQLEEANRISEIHGLPADKRREAKGRQAQAQEQLILLERGDDSGSSDFYTYRYLATEGFLPGYNFPRLPLYAYIPSSGLTGARAAYLQRARFLAIAEFGPQSLIYHEGRAYRVNKARLPADARNSEGRLITRKLFICQSCGASHREETERCAVCGDSLTNSRPISNVLRIDNVETEAAERITANDEERQRRGFEIQTVFEWSRRGHALDVEKAVVRDAEGPFISLDYGPGALISRVNKGLRRRREKSILGFGIDPTSGRWTSAPDDDGDDAPDTAAVQRVVPIVEDNKNAALLRFLGERPLVEAMVTVQHALTRGLEIVFQLEEGEILTEPAPSRDNRRAILAFEAAEGGAGVLGRLVSEPAALARVARAALELTHLTGIDEAIAARDVTLLRDRDDVPCVKGCYRCLLSYYNQPDHELIDRTRADVRTLLLRIACSEVQPLVTAAEAAPGTWHESFARWGLPLPDAEPLSLGKTKLPYVWRTSLAVATTELLDDSERKTLIGQGYEVVDLPTSPGETVPERLASLLGG